jgi:hypothetical protein
MLQADEIILEDLCASLRKSGFHAGIQFSFYIVVEGAATTCEIEIRNNNFRVRNLQSHDAQYVSLSDPEYVHKIEKLCKIYMQRY